MAKYLLNANDKNVRDNLMGLAMTNPNVQLASNSIDAIIRKDVDSLRENDHVLVISGGGAGHEPMFAGFVGPKLLTAAISGAYFASPSAGNIVKLVEQIAKKQTQVLMIQANYTGDRLNFGLAREYLLLKGFKNIGWFVFGDDLAPYLNNVSSQNNDDEDIQIKRRGLAGIAFIHRIAGVLSERRKSLKEIEKYLQLCSKLIFTLSISLSAADIPNHGASFHLPQDQMELGLGAHGESGIQRIPMMSCNETVQLMLNKLIEQLNKKQLLDKYHRRIALIVNNLGGLITMEMNIILKEVFEQLSKNHQIQIERIYWGPIFTSFNMKGVSFSILLVDDLLLNILDESDKVPINRNVNHDFNFKSKLANLSEETNLEMESWNDQRKLFKIIDEQFYCRILKNACQTIINHETILNQLDETIGDSDCGSTLSSIAKLFLFRIDSKDQAIPTFATLAQIVSNNIGGTSGAIYSILFTAAHYFIETYSDSIIINANNSTSKSFDYQEEQNRKKILASFWLELIEYCIKKISTYGGAKINDRSMIDGLHGIVLGLKKHCNNNNTDNNKNKSFREWIQMIADYTWIQAKSTSKMKAKVGRASYVNPDLINKPDAGAYAVAVWIQAIVNTIISEDQ